MMRRRPSLLNREDFHTEESFHFLVESSLSGAYVIQNNLFRYVNRAFAEIFGYEIQEIVGKLGPIELTAPEDRALVAMLLGGRLKEGGAEAKYSIRALRKDGRPLQIETRGTSLKTRSHTTFFGTVIDRTTTAAAEEKFRHFLDEDIAAHYVADPDGFICECNDAFVRLFAFTSREEALKANFASLYPTSSLREAFVQLVRERRRVDQYEAQYVRNDGTRVYVVENAVGEFDSNGKLKSVRGYLLDDTNRRKVEGELYQSQKLENLGTLVGGIAHDFNNVLAIISGHTSVINRARFDQERFDASVEAIKKATKRGAHVVKQLLTFARKVDLVTESVKIGELVEEIVALCKETFNEKITFTVNVEKGLPSIHADPNQLHQVLLNLSVNARDAMPNGGTIKITASKVNRGVLNGNFMDVEAQEYILTQVADTGMGMTSDTLNHIFEPFFTTKKHGQGTGLGLSVVYGIIKSHHGFIDVRSNIGRGTTFSVYLPIPLQKIEDPVVPVEVFDNFKGSGETILIVEDEAPLRDFVESTLKDSGYNVLSASDGIEGAEVYARNQNRVDLILLDMGLPKMTGGELLSVLKKLDPEVRVIAASGYLEPELKVEIFEQGAVDFLSKPYMASEMLKKINEALNPQPDRRSFPFHRTS